MHVSHSYAGDTDSIYSNRWSLIRAAEVFRHSLAALVDEHLDGDGQHEVDVEGLDLMVVQRQRAASRLATLDSSG